MRKNKIYLFGVFLLCAVNISAQEIQPVPQHTVLEKGILTLSAAYRIIGEHEANPHAVKALKRLLPKRVDSKGVVRIIIGERGDKSIRKYGRLIPEQSEGYYLSVDDKEIVLAGNDERGTYYALQTLTQLLEDNTLPQVEITDFPSIRYRGVVEGFYGTPWSHEARLRQLKFYGENKMNTYIYGPKDDPYHSSPHWRSPYPEKEAARLQELVEVARENEVDFVWAIHPGKDIKWNDEDRDMLIAKFEKMYHLGVRSFALFFDDISGEGTNPQKQAELLNYIDENFVKVKQDVKPLIMCPTEYNKSWVSDGGEYLKTLGNSLVPSVQIMWTGDRVVTDIKREGIKWVDSLVKRPVYVWWNFPVSDYVRDHLLLGPVYGNDTQIASLMSGFVTNPMEHPEASKIAIYGVANYAWNPTVYDARKTWQNAMRNILPGAAAELECFASHNSDPGPNWNEFSREESEDMKPLAERILADYVREGKYLPDDMDELEAAFERMQEAADILLVNTENEPLIREITPWLYQFKLLAEMGEEVLEMTDAHQQIDAQDYFLRKYRHVKALQRRMFDLDQIYNQNPYQPGVATASKVLKPLIEQIFTATVKSYNVKYVDSLDVGASYMPHKLTSDVGRVQKLPLQIKANRLLITPFYEIVSWKIGRFVMLELDDIYTIENIEINVGQREPCTWGRLEVSTDGKEWKAIEMKQSGTKLFSDLKQPLKFARFTNVGDKDQQISLRLFALTFAKEKP